MMKRISNRISELALTAGGIGLVLITLSGDTLKWGIWISAVSLVLHIAGMIMGDEE